MKTMVRMIGILNIIMSSMLLILMIFYFVQISQSPNGFLSLALFLVGCYTLILVSILSILLIVIGIRRKWIDMKFYCVTHILLISLNFITILVGNLIHEI